jgi:hypothetical protein
MRVYKFQKFLELPPGVVFLPYKKGLLFGEIAVKGQSIKGSEGEFIDFHYQNLTTEFDVDIPLDLMPLIEEPLKKGYDDFEIPRLDNCGSREGMFDEENAYLVFDRMDVQLVIDNLEDALDSEYYAEEQKG